MKKLFIFFILLLFSYSVFSLDTVQGVIRIEGIVNPNFTLIPSTQLYTFSSRGAINDVVASFKIQTNFKSVIIISLQSKNNFNLISEVEKWPYSLFIQSNGIIMEANGQSLILKNQYDFSLLINYKSYEDLNLFFGNYSDIISITISNF